MIKKTITYTDYNGTERKEDFYFNFNEAELMELEMGTTGGWANMMQSIIDAKDTPSLIKKFKELILMTYGEKTPDGKGFRKSEALSTAFSQTEAYSQLFMELATDADAASNFVLGVIPAKLAAEAKAKGALK